MVLLFWYQEMSNFYVGQILRLEEIKGNLHALVITHRDVYVETIFLNKDLSKYSLYDIVAFEATEWPSKEGEINISKSAIQLSGASGLRKITKPTIII